MPPEGQPFPTQSLKEFGVKPKSTANLPVLFAPSMICHAEAKLLLNNQLTNDTYEFDLKGIGEEPLAEDHLVINC